MTYIWLCLISRVLTCLVAPLTSTFCCSFRWFWLVASVPARFGCVVLCSLGLTSRLFGSCVFCECEQCVHWCCRWGAVTHLCCVTLLWFISLCCLCERATSWQRLDLCVGPWRFMFCCVRVESFVSVYVNGWSCLQTVYITGRSFVGESAVFSHLAALSPLCRVSLWPLSVSQMKIPSKKMAHIPVYTVGFHSTPKSQGHKSQVYKWVRICLQSQLWDYNNRLTSNEGFGIRAAWANSLFWQQMFFFLSCYLIVWKFQK